MEEAITLGSAALELCPPGHPDRGAILYNLTCDLWKKFQKQADMPSWISVAHSTSRADFVSSLLELLLHLWDNNAICFATYALELRLPPEDVSVAGWDSDASPGDEPGRTRHA